MRDRIMLPRYLVKPCAGVYHGLRTTIVFSNSLKEINLFDIYNRQFLVRMIAANNLIPIRRASLQKETSQSKFSLILFYFFATIAMKS